MNTDKIIKLMEERNITVYTVIAIADALEVSIDEIVIRNNYK